MLPKIINIIGLILDIAGAYIMFSNTPHPTKKPQSGKLHEIYQGGAWWNGGKDEESRQKARVKLGMWFLISGFVAQIVSVLLQ